MAGAATSSSRMGITLQGLDQVIALSQANINESLEYYFTAKPELCRFSAKPFLKGTLKPPTIELVDEESADRALYCLTFESGTYYVFDGSGDERKMTGSVPVKGWRLAFEVDFALKKLAQVPKEIADQVQLPGSYSVNQLLVDFGTADVIRFDWSKSKIMGLFDDQEYSARRQMSNCVTKWLNSLKAKDNTGSHNVLGSVVKIEPDGGKSLQDVLSQMPHSTPSFPPTAVRLQTINQRPDGDGDRSSTENDHNAFLFTEMTEGRGLPERDLQWSGDWFYESIGGTLAMSRRIFWDRFVAKKLQLANQRAVECANGVARIMALKQMPQDWLLSGSRDVGDGAWTDVSGLKSYFKYRRENQRTSFEKNVDGPNPQFQFKVTTLIQSILKPFPGEGKLELETVIEIEGKQNINISFVPGWVSGLDVDSQASARSKVIIKFRSVKETGDLAVDVETPDSEIQAVATMSQTSFLAKIPGIGPALESLAKNLTNAEKFEKEISDSIVKVARSGIDVKSQIQDALNGQGRFVFPGGGTFDMKDPIFTQAGDLMVGLTYRKGDAASDG